MNKIIFPFALLLLAIAALAIGGWFYYEQLAATPIWLWIFVPACPLYAGLMSAIILFSIPKNEIYRFVVASAAAAYGTWTIFILFFHFVHYFSAANALQSAILVLGHAGMVVGAFLILPKKKNLIFAAAAVFWLGLNTYLWFDIGKYSLHPWIPPNNMDVVEKITWALAVAWPILLYFAIDWAAKNEKIEKMRKLLAF